MAIARAVVIQPLLVLMDEPLSNLDAALRLEMRAEIRRIHNELGTTMIYVTHDQDEALSMADRIVVLRMAQVRQVGTPEELYDSPAVLDVAAFMGFRNRVPGRWPSADPGRPAECRRRRSRGRARGTAAAAARPSRRSVPRTDRRRPGRHGPTGASSRDRISRPGLCRERNRAGLAWSFQASAVDRASGSR